MQRGTRLYLSQGKYLWDALRDLLGLDERADSSRANAGDTRDAVRTELTACNDNLVAVAGELTQLHERAEQAQARLTATLADVLAREERDDDAARVREQIPSLQATLDATQSSLQLAQARHDALVQQRHALLRTLRNHSGARADTSPEPAGNLRDDPRTRAGIDADGHAKAREALNQTLRIVHIAGYARRCLAQLDTLESAVGSYAATLARKLHPGELTHQRYAQAGDGVSSAVLSGVDEVVEVLQLMKDLDPERIASQIAQAQGTPGAQALRDRLALCNAHIARVESVLARNDAALTALLATAAALSELRGLDEPEHGDFDTVLKDLEVLTQRAQLYR